MPVVAIVGGQWGDEGKGRVVDFLAEKAEVVARFSGGDNAGHTIINPYGEFRLHLVPSGIFRPHTTCIVGNGVVVNPPILLEEIDNLQKHGVATNRLFISDRAHLVTVLTLLCPIMFFLTVWRRKGVVTRLWALHVGELGLPSVTK